jgi:hypothetical protein
MMRAKIQLSPAEQRLIVNAEIILTKNRVMEKMLQLLEGVQAEMLLHIQTFSKPHAFEIPPKISRGENYRGLPYLVLDYPRIFRPDAVFAIRTFFWWGHFFSSTLQLSGVYKTQYRPQLDAAFTTFSNHYIGINTDPWQHHFEPDNYQPVAVLEHVDFKKLLAQEGHLKIAAKWPVSDWQNADTFLIANWKMYLAAILV